MADIHTLQGDSFPMQYFKIFRVVSSSSSSARYTSDFFETRDSNNMFWFCRLRPSKNPNTGTDEYSIEVKVFSCDKKLHAVVCVDVIGLDGKVHHASTEGLAITEKRIGRTMYVPQDGLGRYFLVKVELTIIDEVVDDEPNVKIHSKFISNMASMLYSGKHSDLKICVGREEYSAHKAILSARSPVFAAMFDHEFLESKQHRVIITDVNPIAFWVMLEFIYTNKVTDLDLFAYELLAVADKYAIDDLKSMCEASLSRNIRIPTATQYFLAADLYRSERLRQRSLDFISRNPAVLQTEAWMQMWPTRPDLVNEVLCKVMGQM